MNFQLEVTCSTIGEVNIAADSCLFTPDNAYYARSDTYKVFFGTADTTTTEITNLDSKCFKEITDAADVLTYNLTYKDAADCGWSWDTDEINQKITFGYTLYPTDNINKVTEQGRVVKMTYLGYANILKN